MKHNRTYRNIRRSSRRTKKQGRSTKKQGRRLGTIRRGGATIHEISCGAPICVPIFKA